MRPVEAAVKGGGKGGLRQPTTASALAADLLRKKSDMNHGAAAVVVMRFGIWNVDDSLSQIVLRSTLTKLNDEWRVLRGEAQQLQAG